jgi:hypothetical protein
MESRNEKIQIIVLMGRSVVVVVVCVWVGGENVPPKINTRTTTHR